MSDIQSVKGTNHSVVIKCAKGTACRLHYSGFELNSGEEQHPLCVQECGSWNVGGKLASSRLAAKAASAVPRAHQGDTFRVCAFLLMTFSHQRTVCVGASERWYSLLHIIGSLD